MTHISPWELRINKKILTEIWDHKLIRLNFYPLFHSEIWNKFVELSKYCLRSCTISNLNVYILGVSYSFVFNGNSIKVLILVSEKGVFSFLMGNWTNWILNKFCLCYTIPSIWYSNWYWSNEKFLIDVHWPMFKLKNIEASVIVSHIIDQLWKSYWTDFIQMLIPPVNWLSWK